VISEGFRQQPALLLFWQKKNPKKGVCFFLRLTFLPPPPPLALSLSFSLEKEEEGQGEA